MLIREIRGLILRCYAPCNFDYTCFSTNITGALHLYFWGNE